MGNKKRISFTVTNDLSYDQRMRRICTSLAKANYDITLIGRELPTSLPLTDKPYKEVRLKCFFNNGKMFYLEYNFRLFLFLIWNRFDVFSSIDCDTLWANYFVSLLKGKKLVFDSHELFSEVPEVIRRPKVQKIWRYTEKTLIPKADVCYTVCDSIAQYFEGKYGKPFSTIRNMPYKKEQEILAKLIKIENYILYQGALNEGRGLEQLIQAMTKVDAPLVLVGDGDITEKLKIMVVDLKLQDKVIFIGFIEPADLPNYTAHAKIGINVSQNMGLSYYYSLNNKFFDYVQQGLPAVTNNFPEYVALNKKYGVVELTEGDADSMAAKINLLLNDEVHYNKLKEKCLLAANELNWEKEETKLIELYDKIK